VLKKRLRFIKPNILISTNGARDILSKKKKKKTASLPPTGAGLLRFFEGESSGIRIRPELVIVFSVVLIVVCFLIQLL
jgi:preprotein translocase subunit Sec61beta